MPKYDKITAEYWPVRTKNKDCTVAVSFNESGKYTICDVKWLTLEQARELRDSLISVLNEIQSNSKK